MSVPIKVTPRVGAPGALSIPGATWGPVGICQVPTPRCWWKGMPAGEVQWLHTALLTDRWLLQEAQTPEFGDVSLS